MKTFNTYKEAIDYSVMNPLETVELKSYWSNGQLWDHTFYLDSKKHGEYKDYFSDGQLCNHLFYVDGKTYNVDHLKDSSYKSLCIKHTLFDGNLIDEDI